MNASASDQLEQLGAQLRARDWRLITAESCTGGLIAARITALAGSSDWFEGAFVTYRLSAKRRFLGVPADILDRHGAVSEPVARAMALGALAHSDADISVAVTGLAGPAGGEPLLPVGRVWFAWCDRAGVIQTEPHDFDGDRHAVREAAADLAIAGLLRALDTRSL